jgi:hypothetical protein
MKLITVFVSVKTMKMIFFVGNGNKNGIDIA